MFGHKQESKNTPRAIADFTAKVLMVSSTESVVFKTTDEITDLASSFIRLLKDENPENPYDAIFILTDGYENAYDGLTNEVISIWKSETGRNIPIFQISPITGAEMGADVRKIGNDLITMAINNPVALQPQINARLLEIDTKKWLENKINVLAVSPVSRIRKINVNI